MNFEYSRLDKDELRDLVRHLVLGPRFLEPIRHGQAESTGSSDSNSENQRIDAMQLAAQILTDLRFVQSKCATGLADSLLEDYDLLLALTSGNTRAGRSAKRDAVVLGGTTHTTGFAEMAPRNDQSAFIAEDQQLFIEAGDESVMESTLPGYHQGTERPRSQRRGTLWTLLARYAAFVRQHAHVFAQFHMLPDFCVQQAYSFEQQGPLHQTALSMLENAAPDSPLVLQNELTIPAAEDHPKTIRTRHIMGAGFRSVAITPDGRIACTGGDDRRLRVWDLDHFQCMRTVEVGARLFSVAISANGRLAIGVDDKGCLHCWDLLNLRRHVTIEAHLGYALTCCMTPDGRLALTGGQDKHVKLWELRTGRLLHDFCDPGHGIVNAVAITCDGKRGVSGHSVAPADRVFPLPLVTLNLVDGTVEHSTLVPGFVRAVALEPTTGLIVCGNHDGRLFLVEPGAEETPAGLEAHKGALRSIALDPSGRHILTAGDDGFVKRWDWKRGRCLNALHVHEGGVAALAAAAHAPRLISAGQHDEAIRVWHTRLRNRREDTRLYTEPLEFTRLLPAHNAVLAGGQKGFRIAEMESGRTRSLFEYPHGGSPLLPITVDAQSGRGLCYGDMTARFTFDVSRPNSLRRVAGRRAVTRATLLAGGTHVMVYRPDDCVQVWDCSAEELLPTPLRPWDSEDAPCPLHDNRLVLVTGKDQVLRTADVVTGEYLSAVPLRKGEGGHVICVDGRLAILPTKRNVLRAVDLATGDTILQLEGAPGHFEHCMLTADGRHLICYEDLAHTTLFHVWDLRLRKRLRTFSQSGARLRDVRLAPGDDHLLTLYADDTLRVLDIRTGMCAAAFHDCRGLSAISEMLPDGRMAVGCRTGGLALLQVKGISLSVPFVTPARRWMFPGQAQRGGWRRTLTIVCPWCNRTSSLESQLHGLIGTLPHSGSGAESGVPTLVLADQTWTDDRLLSRCPHCKGKFRLTPFVVDRRKGFRSCLAKGKRGRDWMRQYYQLGRAEAQQCSLCSNRLPFPVALVGYDGDAVCNTCVASFLNTCDGDRWDLQEATCFVCEESRTDGWGTHKGRMCFSCGMVAAERIAYRANIDTWSANEALDALSKHAVLTQRVTAILRQRDIQRSVLRRRSSLVARFIDALVLNLGFEQQEPMGVWVRFTAREACIAIGKRAMPHLLAHHRSQSWRLRANTAFAAARIDSGDPQARVMIRAAAEDEEPRVRSWIPQALMYSQGRWSRRIMGALLDDPDEHVRKEAWRVVDLWDDLAGKDASGDKNYRGLLETFQQRGLTDTDRRDWLKALSERHSTWARKTRQMLQLELSAATVPD